MLETVDDGCGEVKETVRSFVVHLLPGDQMILHRSSEAQYVIGHPLHVVCVHDLSLVFQEELVELVMKPLRVYTALYRGPLNDLVHFIEGADE